MDSSAYERVVSGRLKLKGDPIHSKKQKHVDSTKKRKKECNRCSSVVSTVETDYENDGINHAGWFYIRKGEHLSGPVAFELSPSGNYLSALDNGSLRLEPGSLLDNSPLPHQIFNAVRLDGLLSTTISMGGTALTPVPDDKYAFKTGFGRYLSAAPSTDGRPAQVTASEAEAIGPLEQWVIAEIKDNFAIVLKQAHPPTDTNEPVAAIAGGNGMIIRAFGKKMDEKKECDPITGLSTHYDLRQTEQNLVKMFQKFQGKKKLNSESVNALETAKKQGNLHETMLDRREKMKSDRYCK